MDAAAAAEVVLYKEILCFILNQQLTEISNSVEGPVRN